MPSHRDSISPPRSRPRDRKQQILVAARDLFAEKGFPNVTMAEVANHVGITAGALYRHFGNKLLLLEEVVAESFGWIEDPVAEVEYSQMVEDAVGRIADRPYLSDLWMHEIRHLPDEQRANLRHRMSSWHRSLLPAVQRERPDLDAGQAELLTWSLQSLLACIGRRALRSPPSVRLPIVRAALASLTTAQLMPTGEALPTSGARLEPVSMRERLLIAAHEQFGDRGYQETSMASLGAAADVSGPNIYSYFDSKGALLRAVLERGTHALWLSLDDALATSPTAADALPKLVRSYVGASRSWASLLEGPTGEFTLDDAATITQREYVAEWVALLRQVVPALNAKQARVRVQVTLLLVADLHRTGSLATRASFQENVARVALTVLFDGRDLASVDA